MMQRDSSQRLSEAAIVQNPALGAFAIWKFGLAYQAGDGLPAAFPLAFLVLPLVMHAPTLKLVLSTQKASGFHLFAGKLNEKREDLLGIHGRVMLLRRLSLESIIWAEQSRLLRIDAPTATFWANELYEGQHAPILADRIRQISPACERLGIWFSAVSDQQIVHTLRVDF